MALDIRSPMDLVYECFAKLGLRYICVLRDGNYAGMVSAVHELKHTCFELLFLTNTNILFRCTRRLWSGSCANRRKSNTPSEQSLGFINGLVIIYQIICKARGAD